MPLNLTRSLLVVLVPGAIFIAPWVLLLLLISGFGEFYAKFPQFIWAAVFVTVIVAGAVIEGSNSYLERQWDEELERDGFEVDKDWFDYLSYLPDEQPNGIEYLHRMATTMYFELAMHRAVLGFGAGFAIWLGIATLPSIQSLRVAIETVPFLWMGVVAPGVGVFTGIAGAIGVAYCTRFVSGKFSAWAKDSHEVLCNTRKEINLRLRKSPHDESHAATSPESRAPLKVSPLAEAVQTPEFTPSVSV